MSGIRDILTLDSTGLGQPYLTYKFPLETSQERLLLSAFLSAFSHTAYTSYRVSSGKLHLTHTSFLRRCPSPSFSNSPGCTFANGLFLFLF